MKFRQNYRVRLLPHGLWPIAPWLRLIRRLKLSSYGCSVFLPSEVACQSVPDFLSRKHQCSGETPVGGPLPGTGFALSKDQKAYDHHE
jgi:hypothetical protein